MIRLENSASHTCFLYFLIYILVTPGTPKNVSAYLYQNCLRVSWTKIETGGCPVFYTVQYNETTLITGTKFVNYVKCNFHASANDAVYVRAEGGGRNGDFTVALIILAIPTPPPPTTKTTASTPSGSTTPTSGRLLCHNLLLEYAYIIYNL